MRPDRLRLRTAVRLREIYVSRAAQAVEQFLVKRLGDYRQALERTQAGLRAAAAQGWLGVASRVRRGLRGLTSAVRDVVRDTDHRLKQPPQQVAPELRDLVAELEQFDDEFGGLQVDLKQKTLRVTTEPIELDEVFLGPFAIQLQWQRLEREASSRCFEVIALDPRPAATKPDVTHPHVSGGSLCAGDATLPIQHALEQGRLADAFCLVRSVLTHYNPSSAHVTLDEWGSQDCHECSGHTHPDDLSACDRCGFDYCAECRGSCAVCGELRCHECLHHCARDPAPSTK
jgi:hypothetical protein